jgi:hypothetical protein
MSRMLNESINFLLSEYKRLKLKEDNKKITKEEKEALDKIKSFIGKENEK